MKRWHVWHGGNYDLNFISAKSFVHFAEEATFSNIFQLKLWIWFNWIIILLGFLFWIRLGSEFRLLEKRKLMQYQSLICQNFDNRNFFDVTNLSPSRITLKTHNLYICLMLETIWQCSERIRPTHAFFILQMLCKDFLWSLSNFLEIYSASVVLPYFLYNR